MQKSLGTTNHFIFIAHIQNLEQGNIYQINMYQQWEKLPQWIEETCTMKNEKTFLRIEPLIVGELFTKTG